MALPTASDNPFPSLLITEGTEPTAPAAGKQRLYIDSTSHKLKRTDSSGVDVTIEGAASGAVTASGLTMATARLLGRTTASTGAVEEITVGSGLSLSAGSLTATITTTVATDTIWDAAGDLAVGSGADTAAKLVKGSAGATLAMGNSAVIWNAGTSMPGSKATNDRYWRTDLSKEYFWDGTRWLTTELFRESFTSADQLMPSAGTFLQLLPTSGVDSWVEQIVVVTQVTAPNDATKFWAVGVKRYPSATQLGSDTLTDGDTAATPTRHTITVGALVGTSDPMLLLYGVKTSTPGAIFVAASIYYREVGT